MGPGGPSGLHDLGAPCGAVSVHLARAFARIDTDGDGYITLDEMVEGAAQHQRTVESRSVPPGKIVEGLLAARGA